MEEAYDNFCGSLEYILDPTGTAQTYLTYDGTTLLTLAPDETDPTGVLGHTLRARLVEYPTVYHDEPFTVEVKACDITAFYADSVDSVTILPVRESTTIGVTNFVIGSDPEITHTFTFSDFDVAQNDGCELLYPLKYKLFFEGVDISQSLPDWVSAFDPALPSVTISFVDTTALGSFTLSVKGEL